MTGEAFDDGPAPDGLLRAWRAPAGATGRGVIVHAVGEVDVVSVDILRDALGDVPPSDGPVILDLTEVTFFGSAGCGLLAEQYVRHRDAGGDLRLICNRLVARTITMTGMDGVLNMFDTLDQALA